MDLRFLRCFSGTEASSWHSFSAHSLNPKPELSPPATCLKEETENDRVIWHNKWTDLKKTRTRPLVYLSIYKQKMMGSYEAELSQSNSYQSKRFSFKLDISKSKELYGFNTIYNFYFSNISHFPPWVNIFSLYFVVEHPNKVVLYKILPSSIR